ncbi:MAG: response regulator [Nitrospira sp.]|nr:response regulator [Nitrospira sp.]
MICRGGAPSGLPPTSGERRLSAQNHVAGDTASGVRGGQFRRLVALVVACILVVTVVGSATSQYLQVRMVAQAGENLALAAVDIAGKLDLLMAERYGDIQMMARSGAVHCCDAAAMTDDLTWMATVYPVYAWLGVTDSAGRIVASTDPASIGNDRSGQEWFRVSKDRGVISVGDAQLSEESPGVSAVAFTAPIRGMRNEFLGTITSRVALPVLEDVFVETVTALQAQWGTDVRVEYQFVNREGEVIADSLLREERRANLKRMGLPSAKLFDTAPPGFVEERHLRRKVDVVTGYAMTKGVGDLGALRWGVLVRVDRSDILAPIRTIVWNVGAAGAGMLLPLVGLVLWSVRRLERACAAAQEDNERAKSAESKFQKLVESAPDAVVVADEDGRIVSWNAVASRLFGYAAFEVIGRPLTVMIPPRYRDAHAQGIQRLQAMGQPRLIGKITEVHGLRKDGTEFPIDLSLGTWETEGTSFYSGIIRDISERKRAEKELLVAKEAAESGSRAKGEFLATMSHEIRTPMNGVIGTTGLLLDTELTAEQREYAEMIRCSGEVLLDIINDILDFSKIDARKLDLELLDFDLRTTVEDAVSMQAERAHSKGLELACLINGTVPTAVCGDPGRLRQILTNLIGNAIKFTERGEVVVTVSVVGQAGTQEQPSVELRFEVADTGIGMTATQCANIFQPFVQADGSMARKYGGTGLGLAICKQLTELMQGRIGVESVPGEGSRFWFTVRLTRQPEGRHGAEPSGRLLIPLRGRKALIVDDNAMNRKILEQQFKAQGMAHESAENGHHALEALRRAADEGRPFDLAILDMHIPDMDGIELARRIKVDPAISSVHLVLFTSLGRRGDMTTARDAGIAAYLTKPMRQAQLLDCLSLVLRGVERPLVESLSRETKTIVTRHSLAEAQSGLRGRVLVVEDNPVNQKVAVKMLEKFGCRVDVAANGREAVQAVARLPYSIVFMDCQMPEMDGFEATRLIRLEERAGLHLTIVAMTANAMVEDRERCLKAGMDDYLSKPVQSQGFADALSRWLPSQKP